LPETERFRDCERSAGHTQRRFVSHYPFAGKRAVPNLALPYTRLDYVLGPLDLGGRRAEYLIRDFDLIRVNAPHSGKSK
jgi:hypothetical protein